MPLYALAVWSALQATAMAAPPASQPAPTSPTPDEIAIPDIVDPVTCPSGRVSGPCTPDPALIGLDLKALKARLGDPQGTDPDEHEAQTPGRPVQWTYHFPRDCTDFLTTLTLHIQEGRVRKASAKVEYTGFNCADPF